MVLRQDQDRKFKTRGVQDFSCLAKDPKTERPNQTLIPKFVLFFYELCILCNKTENTSAMSRLKLSLDAIKTETKTTQTSVLVLVLFTTKTYPEIRRVKKFFATRTGTETENLRTGTSMETRISQFKKSEPETIN